MTMTWTRLRVAMTIFLLITVVGCDEDIEVVVYDTYPTTTYVYYDDCDCDCGGGLWFCW